jgi:G:T/U-mismatch repair DNA glycosylase
LGKPPKVQSFLHPQPAFWRMTEQLRDTDGKLD